MQISVIMTTKNEEASISRLLDSLLDQTVRADEIVICDAGSTDATISIVESYKQWLPIQLLHYPNCNISQGRNRAISVASGEIIAATDAGVILNPFWVQAITEPIRQGETAVVSGWFESDPYTDFEVILGSTVLPDRTEIDPDSFLPSSRSIAFLKSAWQSVGGYPEWLDYSEDLLFDLALKKKYAPFAFTSLAVAYFQPRSDLRSFARQYFLYARGDGKANLWPKRHAIRYLTYIVALPSILYLIWHDRKIGWPLLFTGVGSYCYRPWFKVWKNTTDWRPPNRVRALAFVPIIRFIGDAAKMLGYPIGLWWRWRNRR